MSKTVLTAYGIARVCHEANRAYCLALGDDSQPRWEDAPDWQRDSAVAGVRLHLDEPMTPRESHEAWMAHKAAEGWVYGDTKDAEAKTHPCMAPYDQLPLEQRRKDELFGAVVSALRGEG